MPGMQGVPVLCYGVIYFSNNYLIFKKKKQKKQTIKNNSTAWFGLHVHSCYIPR